MVLDPDSKTNKTPVEPNASEKPLTEGERTRELGGPKGLEPTRYGDWERKGRCIDF